MFDVCIYDWHNTLLILQMEAFVVLFFTFLCQHIQTLQKSAASTFSWLQNDCNLDQIREYFPSHVIRGINPSAESPIQLRLSVILNAFHQFIVKFEEIVCENKSLASRAMLLQDVIKRSTNLEDEIQEYRRKQFQLVWLHIYVCSSWILIKGSTHSKIRGPWTVACSKSISKGPNLETHGAR